MIVTDQSLLRVECSDVLPEEVAALREVLERELKHSEENGAPGIGLAAPQIGIAKKMAIVRIPGPQGKNYNVDLVNCRIAEKYDQAFFDGEGCLSFPGLRVRTLRYQEIHVVDNLVQPYSFTATGLPAVCIQHELDHLLGILLPDVDVSAKKHK